MPVAKRNLLAQSLGASGLLRLLEGLSPRRRLVILAYHRIGTPAGCPFDRGQFSATAEEFESQARYIRDRYRLLGLTELVRMADDALRVNEPCALLTFDDGYRDNFETAFPILQKLGMSATFFVPTAYITHPRLPWWDRIHYVLRQSRRSSLALRIGKEEITFDLDGESRDQAISRVLGLFKRSRDIEEEKFFDHLEERADVSVDAEALGRELFMSWSELTELAAAGIGIGAHSHSHRILARLPAGAQQRELARSKSLLEERLQRPIEALAYPVGRHDAFDGTTKRLAKEVGYKVAFSYYGGINRAGAVDFMDLRRVRVESSDSLRLLRLRIARESLSSLAASVQSSAARSGGNL